MDAIADHAQFDAWLSQMQQALNKFKDSVPPALRSRLDGSVESLDALEAWLLQRYGSVADARPDSEAFAVGAAARYVGEMFRLRVGGVWRLEDSDPSMVFFGLPVITGGALGDSTRCPRSYITAALDRRTGTYLSRLYQALPFAKTRQMQ
jgi:hypothetical protein